MTKRPALLLAAAARRLAVAGVASPQTDARLLLQHATGLSQTQLLTTAGLLPEQIERFEGLLDQRTRGVPVQHLVGHAWFRGLQIAVGPGVFIPRPETELLAQAVIDELAPHEGGVVVELCAGSGAISAAVAAEVPGSRVHAVEREPDAARWLRRNLAASGAQVVVADMADALPQLNGLVDVVVANPPYIPWSQRADLPIEVRDHDPAAALFAEDDGMAAIQVVIEVAARLLRPGGLVAIEHGDDQSPAVLAALQQAGFADATRHQDLAGRPRFATGRAMSGWEGE